jgi:ketosteroid isomerase-like protein
MKNAILSILGLLIMSITAVAQTPAEKEVREVIESLRKAMMSADKATLEKIAADDLSYGHSSGLIEDKVTFVNSIVSGKFGFVKIEFPDMSVRILDNTAIVRHKMTGDTTNDGKPGTVNIGIMVVLHKQKGAWKMVARQAYKL